MQVDVNAEKRIAQLQDQIEQLKARLPKHSVPAAMIIELEDLEDELQALQTQVERDQGER
ncbi:MAG: histidine kinase [Anaerolineae bacterium]|nr:histidine kinase [Anaerolineae bacterium]